MSIGANWAEVWSPVWGQVWTQTPAVVLPVTIDTHDGGAGRKKELDEYRKRKERLRETIEQAFGTPIAEAIKQIAEPYKEPGKTSGRQLTYDLDAIARNDEAFKQIITKWLEYQDEEEAIVNLLLM